jgi:hypothetical protein
MLAIVSHDAGGAEILSSWLLENPQPHLLVLDGPAVSIFQSKLGSIKVVPLRVAIESSSWVLCGTSWQSDLEKKAILEAKSVGKKVVSYLDHWVNYRERFQFNGIDVLPDEIWVGDKEAEKIAGSVFLNSKIVLISNPYYKELLNNFRFLPARIFNPKKVSILYVCEPIREHAFVVYGDERIWGYTEEEALNFFLKNIDSVGGGIVDIKIRPHPSEAINKYSWACKKSPLISEINNKRPLVEQIAMADIVVGCESMAMVMALLVGKRVISSIPDGGRLCQLPQANIQHMCQLIKNYKGNSLDL